MKKTDKQLDKFLRKKPKLGRGVYIAKTAVVLGDVTIGAHSSVWYGAVLRGDINRIVVGHHTNIQDNAVLHLADDFACVVGNWVTVGHGAIVHACRVGDEVLVGMGAVILDGAVIGKQSHHRREGAGEAGNENSAWLARAGRAGKSCAQADQEGTRRPEMVGAKIRGQRRLLPEARNQRGRAAADLKCSRQGNEDGFGQWHRITAQIFKGSRSEWAAAQILPSASASTMPTIGSESFFAGRRMNGRNSMNGRDSRFVFKDRRVPPDHGLMSAAEILHC